MKRSLVSLALIASFPLAGCENKSGGPPAPSASAASASAPVASASVASASAAPSASASAAPSAASAGWAGAYKSAAGAVSLPAGKDFKDVTWKGDDAGVGIGEGTISITVDGATGRVTGTAEGALGAVVLDGMLVDGAFTASIARKDPSDRGLIGTAIGKATGDKIDGTMSLSSPDAVIVRKATFSLAKK